MENGRLNKEQFSPISFYCFFCDFIKLMNITVLTCFDCNSDPTPDYDEDPDDMTPHHGDYGAEDDCEDEPVMLLYRKAVQKRLQAELVTQGKNLLPSLESKWLLEYLKTHNWTIQNYDAQYI